MMVRNIHYCEDKLQGILRNAGMEEIAHGPDKDVTGSFPVDRLRHPVFVHRN